MGGGPDDLLQRLMNRDVVSADPGATLRELAEIMYGEEVGSVVIRPGYSGILHVPVLQDGRPVGMVSGRDLLMALTAS
jgi:CBS domain-containing protein